MMNETEIIEAIRGSADRYEELVWRYHLGLIIHCENLVSDRDFWQILILPKLSILPSYNMITFNRFSLPAVK